MANYKKINNFDIANGRSIRVSIFFSGCDFHCHNCFNRELWSFENGELFTREVYDKKIKPKITEHIAGLSILGGEPMHPKNIWTTYMLVKWFKEDFPDKDIWMWSGYTYEELISEEYETTLDSDGYALGINLIILTSINVLIDGKFIEEKKDLTLKWRGSRNQRVIDIKESMKQGKVALLDD